jgi:hypothetical protein
MEKVWGKRLEEKTRTVFDIGSEGVASQDIVSVTNWPKKFK